MQRQNRYPHASTNPIVIFQDPLTALTPQLTVGQQLKEILQIHEGMRGKAATALCIEWLEKVRISDAERSLRQYPNELFGGMRQRVMIAMAMECGPEVLLADEPTTAIDVTVQAQVLELVDDLRRETNTGIVLNTHDMGVVARMRQRIIVMRKSEIVQVGSVDTIFIAPQQPHL